LLTEKEKIMAKSSRMLGVLALLLAFGAAASLPAQVLWTGEGADNLWDNPDNWVDGFVPSAADRAMINGPDAEGDNGPLIQDGIDAVTEILISEAGIANMTMTGGTLELSGWGMWWGDGAGNTATFDMSGGEITFTGSPGIMEMGWQDANDPPGSSVGIWNMTGGEIYALGMDVPGKGNGGVGIINLYGGVINVGTARGGLTLHEGAQIDITEGTMILEGDQTALVEDYIAEQWIMAYGGTGDVVVSLANDYTTITGKSNFIPGDFNGDGVLDSQDIDDLTVQSAKRTNPPAYDLNNDSLVDDADVKVWVKDLFKSWIGDANLDKQFNSTDLVDVLASGTYEANVDSVWSSGDFDGDGRTNSGDLIAALADGGYELGSPAAVAVPEPHGALLVLAALSGLLGARRRSDLHPFDHIDHRRGSVAGRFFISRARAW
jgi:hypothetical protein